jgi:ABC-type phosphate/phosphonate transport system permease subunit
MLKIYFILLWFFINWYTYAVEWAKNTWFLGWCWKTSEALREWNIHITDFSCMIRFMIDFFLAFAATISLIFIIIWAYQVAFWSLSDNKTQWKDTIMMAIWGLVLAALSWVIIKFIFENIA